MTPVPEGQRGTRARRHTKRYPIGGRIPLIGLALGTLAGATSAGAAEPAAPALLALEGDISPVHDPALIRQDAAYYLFATNRYAGRLLPMFCSQDLARWALCGNAFDRVPEWALRDVPGARGIWAPDIGYLRGRYHLYYSVSTFGSNRSVIGLATNATLDPTSPDYRWIDEGKVVGSTPDDDWNAIDPNLAFDADGAPWLSWGSFWGGIKLRRVDPETGKLSESDPELYSLASRRPLQPPAIEAPFIVQKDGHYYLFVSFDRCCRGVDSDYKVVVGRAGEITGPYLDREGRGMLEGGGTLLLEGSGAWRGPGHQAVLLEPDRDLLVFHAYDAISGRPTLHISTMVWEDGWPRVGRLE
jgi:arabinan endo-1,5-alpha-L-arabinosidase